MGLIQKGNFLYLQAKKGYLSQGVQKEDKTWENVQHKGYEGTLVGIRQIPKKFGEVTTQYFELRMKDNESDQVACIQFPVESYMTLTFFSRLSNLNLEDPFKLGVYPSKGENPATYAYIYQHGNKVNPVEKFPEPAKVTKASGKVEKDWDAVVVECKRLVSELGLDVPVVAEKEAVATEATDDENIPF